MEEDTIAAVATAPGEAAVALVRVSGPRAVEVVGARFSGPRPLSECPPRTQVFGTLADASGRPLDEVLVARFEGPASYTGEDVVEIGCHGGVLVVRSVLDSLLEAGARAAGPGEFTQRAFFNGKMDLTQAEAVMDLISAQTTLALRSAREQLAGRLGTEILDLRDRLVSALAHLEAHIDFPDEDIDPETGTALDQKLGTVASRIADLLRTAEHGRILRHGVRTVICGLPNVGKSSLLNLLLGFERAIVSDIAGTTRDTIEETVNLKGYPLRLIDTAGVQPSNDALENAGIARTRSQLENADLIIEVLDLSAGPGQPRADLGNTTGALHLVAGNKADLGTHPEWSADNQPGATLSCLTGQGADQLAQAIAHALQERGGWIGDAVAINARHQQCLSMAARALDAARLALAHHAAPELVAVDLRAALDHIGDVVGRVSTDDILGEIFASFCIGK